MRKCKYDGAALRAIRAEKGVGRPCPPQWVAEVEEMLPAYAEPCYADTLKCYGSQRKAAATLGLSLGTFQRRLKKEAA